MNCEPPLCLRRATYFWILEVVVCSLVVAAEIHGADDMAYSTHLAIADGEAKRLEIQAALLQQIMETPYTALAS